MTRAAAPSRAVPLVAVDANALDRDGSPGDALVDAFHAAVAAGRLVLFVPAGVLAEMSDPAAPEPVRAAAMRLPPLPRRAAPTARQHIDRIRVRAIMRGDGRPGKHDADASHLSEAAEAGCDAFVTRDGKILRRRDVLRQALPPNLRIGTLAEILSGLRRMALGARRDPAPLPLEVEPGSVGEPTDPGLAAGGGAADRSL